MVGCKQGPLPRIIRSFPLSAPTFQTSFANPAFARPRPRAGVGRRALADDLRPLDLEATSNALSVIENTLRQPNLADADLQRLRAENDPLGVALQAAIADMSPRLAASAKRLAELTPKTKDNIAAPVPETDAAATELASEKQKHDALDANLRTARALLLKVDDNATRIGSKRRDLFARQTFARSSSVFNPQLWQSVSHEVPADAQAISTVIGDWFSGLRGRMTAAQALGMAGSVLLLALAAVPIHWMARRVIYRDPGVRPPGRLRRALAAGWTMLVLAVLPLLGLWGLALALDAFDLSDPRMQGALDAVFDAARLMILVNAVGRGMLAPRAEAWRRRSVQRSGGAARLPRRSWRSRRSGGRSGSSSPPPTPRRRSTSPSPAARSAPCWSRWPSPIPAGGSRPATRPP